MRERKKSSVAGQANITAELPENSLYWKSNWEKRPSEDTPENQCSCGFRGFFKADYLSSNDPDTRCSIGDLSRCEETRIMRLGQRSGEPAEQECGGSGLGQ
jgi:hypothetical protein